MPPHPLELCPPFLHRPERDGEGVGPAMVEYALGDGVPRLRADVRHKLAELVAVDEELEAELAFCDTRAELEGEGDVVAPRQVEVEGRGVEGDPRSGDGVGRAAGFPAR